MRVGKNLRLAPIIVALATAANAESGPFGLNLVEFNLSDYGCVSVMQTMDGKPSGDSYICDGVPNPYPAPGMHLVLYRPEFGVCSVSFVADAFEDSPFGTKSRKTVDSVYDQIAARYGPGEQHDVVSEGAKISAPDRWLEAVRFKERRYGYVGDVRPQVSGVSAYYLFLRSRVAGEASWTVQFTTQAYTECKAAADADLGIKKNVF